MPEISRFYGIIIRMYFNEHEPPHFHAEYGAQQALIAIESLAVIEGRLVPRALGLVTEWAALHQSELLDRWAMARSLEAIERIEPLP
jgi:hypothetical protein